VSVERLSQGVGVKRRMMLLRLSRHEDPRSPWRERL
jgi:hypothetical protein